MTSLPLPRWARPRGPAGAACRAALAAGAFALALQVQVTVAAGDTHVRLAASDLLGLLLAPYALLLLMRNHAALRRVRWYRWLALIGAATLAMSWSAAVGAWEAEGLTGWALTKYSGWFVLLGYLAMGLLLAFDAPDAAPLAFIRCLALALACTVLAYIVLTSQGKLWSLSGDVRLSGFAENPNAFGLMLLCGLAFALAQGRDEPGWGWLAGALCAGVLFCRSVAALIGLIALVPVFLLLCRPRPGAVARIALAAALLAAAPSALNKGLNMLYPDQVPASERYGIADKIDAFSARGEKKSLYDSSIPSRMESGRQALANWMERPVFGIGLGRFLQQDSVRAAQDRPVMVIHSTPLWLLTETGLLGLVAFAALFGVLALDLLRAASGSGSGGRRAAFLHGGLLLLIAWAVMSLAHELLYQRMPWFALGLCAGLMLRSRSFSQASGQKGREGFPPGSKE